MNSLQKINYVIAITAAGFGIYHFFIDRLHFSESMVFTFLALMLLLQGMQGIIEERTDKANYVTIGVSILLFLGVVVDLWQGI